MVVNLCKKYQILSLEGSLSSRFDAVAEYVEGKYRRLLVNQASRETTAILEQMLEATVQKKQLVNKLVARG